VEAIERAGTAQRRWAWPGKLRAIIAIGLAWAALHYVLGSTVLARGLERPALVLIGDGGLLAGAATLILILAIGLIAVLLCGGRDGAQGLFVVGFGLALWAWPAGTMDDWLILRNPTVGPPTGGPYWPLLAEYFYWAVVVLALLALTGGHQARADSGKAGSRAGPFGVLGLDTTPAALRDGIVTLIVTVMSAGVLILVLTGPRVGHTYRGQVYFAVGLAFIVAVMIAWRVGGARGLIWYLPGPFVVGVIGALVAAWRPGLGPAYENVNVIPAWGLVRPLPVEMVSVGLVATILACRMMSRVSSGKDQG
jgi:hypothetical protein